MITKGRHRALALCTSLIAVACADVAEDQTSLDAADPLGSEVLTPPAEAFAATPDPNSTYISSLRASGSGCPAGSWKGDISGDGLAFTLTFSKYSVDLDVNKADLSISLNCNITLGLHTPPGTTYAITKFAYQGYAYVEEGGLAKQKVQYAFQGQGGNLKESTFVMQGPFDQGFLFEDDVETRAKVLDYAPCGSTRTLQLRTVLAAERTSKSVVAMANTTSIDGETKQTTPVRRDHKLIVAFKQAACPRGQAM